MLYRNVCAHNERLFSHKVYSEILDTTLHRKLNVKKIGNQYEVGKRDLFLIVIALRYLLTKEDFITFKKKINNLLRGYLSNNRPIGKTELLKKMSFPENWGKITRYKI